MHPLFNSRLKLVECKRCGGLYGRYGTSKYCQFCRDVVMEEQRREAYERSKANRSGEQGQ